MIIPRFAAVINHGWAEAPGGVDASSSDGNGCKMHHEHCKANGEWSQNLEINSNAIS